MTKAKSPLFISHANDRQGEYFNLNGTYLFTVQQFDATDSLVFHAQTAPGFFTAQSGILTELYHPDQRPQHRHDSLELIYVLRGSLTQFIEDYCHTYTEGSCCILSKNIRHVESFSSDFEAVFVLLSDAFIQTVLDGDVCFSPDFSCRQNTNPVSRQLISLLKEHPAFEKKMFDFIPLKPASELRDEAEVLFAHMILETRKQSPGCFPIVCGYFARLFSLLAAEDCYQLHPICLKSSNEDFIFNQILLYLQNHHGRVDYDELEALLHYTRDYLNRIVKRRRGCTLTALAQWICLEEAAHLLLTSSKSIGEIMQELGYANRTYFYRIFRERFGATPLAYRRSSTDSHEFSFSSPSAPTPPLSI